MVVMGVLEPAHFSCGSAADEAVAHALAAASLMRSRFAVLWQRSLVWQRSRGARRLGP